MDSAIDTIEQLQLGQQFYCLLSVVDLEISLELTSL